MSAARTWALAVPVWTLLWAAAGLLGAGVVTLRGAGPVPPLWLWLGLPLVGGLAGLCGGLVWSALVWLLPARWASDATGAALAGMLAGALAGVVVLGRLGGFAQAPVWGAGLGVLTALVCWRWLRR